MGCRSSTSRPPQPPLKLGTQSRHYLTSSAPAVEASRTGTNRLERVEWLWILNFLMIKFLRYCRPGVGDPFVICKSESSRTQQKHLHCTIERCGCQKACIQFFLCLVALMHVCAFCVSCFCACSRFCFTGKALRFSIYLSWWHVGGLLIRLMRLESDGKRAKKKAVLQV